MKPTRPPTRLWAVSYGKPHAEVTDLGAPGNCATDRSGYFDRRFGSSASTGTRNTPARAMSSMSVTHRTWSSIRATMSRLTSHPDNWHFAANCACDKPSLLRNDISRGPTAFLGSVIRRHFSDAGGYLVSPLAFVWFSTHVQITAMKGDHP
jgi:hypothetical protein